jgi:hypothetical protein
VHTLQLKHAGRDAAREHAAGLYANAMEGCHLAFQKRPIPAVEQVTGIFGECKAKKINLAYRRLVEIGEASGMRHFK